MPWRVEFDPTCERQLRRLDRPVAKRILKTFAELALLQDPRVRCKPLRGPLSALWRLRVEDYRAILDIRNGEMVILALDLGHRSEIYED